MVRKEDGQGRVLPALAFNVIKPCSPESRLISELATEVAYLVGSRGNKCKSPRTTRSSSSQEPTVAAKQQDRVWSSTAKETTEATERRADVNRDAGPSLGLGSPTNDAAGTESGNSDVRADGDQDKVVSPITPTRGQGVSINDGVVSGRPGTYLGCGVTTCKGLGFTGEHGDVAGNAPHAAFVRRKVESGGGVGGDGVESVAGDDDMLDTRGDASLGIDGSSKDVGHATNDNEEGATGKSPTASPDVDVDVVETPLALLSAREPGFRNELIRRKEHYGLGGMRKQDASVGGEKEGVASLQIPAIVEQDAETVRRGAPAAVCGGRSIEAPRRSRPSRKLGGSSPLPVDIAESPLMASTRPAAVNPASESCRIDTACQDEGVSKSCRSKCVGPFGDKEFVKFARPAAHWSVTNGLRASPGRARGKSVRVPKGTSEGVGGGLVVGRFACRGYLLDPTFTDSNPIILHPRLPQIDGGGGGFCQVPEGSTLAELVASPAAKDGKNGGARADGRVEPYRNVVEVLRHNVGVSGGREATKNFHVTM